MSYFDDVKDFHRNVLGISSWTYTQQLLGERTHFLFEEVLEFDRAKNALDIVGMADALADIIYVALGTAHILDLPFEEIWAVVQKANMAKVRGTTKRGNAIDAAKPEGWVSPEAEIRECILRSRHASK